MSNNIFSEEEIRQTLADIEADEQRELERHHKALKQLSWRVLQVRRACRHPQHKLVLVCCGVYETDAEYECTLCKAVVVRPKKFNYGRQ